jgi:hypothetical protein
MLHDVLRLTSTVKVTPEKLRAFCALTDPVAVAWRNDGDGDETLRPLREAADPA